jgi:hypothetical protein
MSEQLKRRIKFFIISFIYFPVLYFVLFFLFIIKGRSTLGKMPEYLDPSPIELGFDIHYQLINFVIEGLWPLSFLVLVIYIISCLLTNKNVLNINKIHFFMYFLFYVFFLVTYLTDTYHWIF